MVDRIEFWLTFEQHQHDLNVWRPAAQPHFVTVTNGGFQLDSKPWKAQGVNYMPSSGIALNGPAFEHWVGAGAYDPEIIQRDLNHIRQMGFNSVSVFIYYQSLKAQHMLDFLRRCENLGLKVNLSLRPGTPLEFRWNEMKALIEHYRMASNDTVFAYDLAWEPSHFDHNYQKRYTKDWNRWLLNRYGNLAKATNTWSFTPNLSSDKAEIPNPTQLYNDGPWRKMIADYRLFLDDMLGAAYSDARAKVRSIDPNHPVSFRMQHAGDPTHTLTNLLPYDFYGLRNAVDIWEPEAYGRVGDWSRVKAGAFTAAYAHLCNPQLPVVWAEVGYDIWNNDTMRTDPQKTEFCTRYFRDFYKMLNLSGADGVFFWWYPGGFRLNENSDYGLINPDGTDRPTTKVIREEGARFLQTPKPVLPPVTIQVDRDADSRGLPAMYEKASEAFWNALDHGQQPQLDWAHPPAGAN